MERENAVKKAAKELVETFKSRMKLAITTAVAYMLWISFYKIIREILSVFLPVYSGLLGCIVELIIISFIAVITLYLLSKWK